MANNKNSKNNTDVEHLFNVSLKAVKHLSDVFDSLFYAGANDDQIIKIARKIHDLRGRGPFRHAIETEKKGGARTELS